MVCLSQQSARSVWEVAREQHGVVGRGQLVALGLSRRAIQHRVARGRLHPVRHGVYAVGRREIDTYGRWIAAVFACGGGAFLTHGSAAALWGIRPGGLAPIEVAVRSSSDRRHPDIRIHRRPKLLARDIVSHVRIPVTNPILTLVDIASRLDHAGVERAVNEADRLDLVDPEALRAGLERYRGRRGVARLRELLDRRTFRLTDSELERFFLPLAARAGLPVPVTRAHLNGFRVDFLWPDLRLVVETDGLRYHRTPAQQARDRRRDQEHLAAGYTPLRFTHEQVRYAPERVISTLRAVFARLGDREPFAEA
jgi:very-short-patch-repair endonuclease